MEVFEKAITQVIRKVKHINAMEFGLMSGKGTISKMTFLKYKNCRREM